jgi:hypothetical protein
LREIRNNKLPGTTGLSLGQVVPKPRVGIQGIQIDIAGVKSQMTLALDHGPKPAAGVDTTLPLTGLAAPKNAAKCA